jgi:2,5-diamino-6-(ribosylamino)-4(3H)-pyrimidinone 5'-phosphate reductase
MLPKVILHNAVSIDGRITDFPADMGVYYTIAMEFGEGATLVGADTILSAPEEVPPEDEGAFEPPVREKGDKRPILVIPDSRGRLDSWHHWRCQPYWRDWVALVSHSTPKRYLKYLEKRHIGYIVAGKRKVDLRKALEELRARYKVRKVRTDSGGNLNGALFDAGLIDEVSVLVEPYIVGGPTPLTLVHNAGPGGPDDALRLRLAGVEKRRGGIVWLRYRVVKDKRKESGKRK